MKLLLIIPIILGLSYCTSTQLPDPNDDSTVISKSIDNEALILEKVRLLMEDSSLDSLNSAIQLIDKGSVGNIEKGSFYKVIALSLIKLVYPYSQNSVAVINYPKTGILSDIVSKAGNGEILNLAKQNVNFFTLLLSSTAALYTKSDAVFTQSSEIIKTIYEGDLNLFFPVFMESFINEKQKFYEEALKGYTKALKLDPFSYPAELGMIRILIINSEYNEALSHIDNVLKQYSEQLEVQYLYVDALIGNNQLEEASRLVTSYLALNPDDRGLILRYADVLQREGKNIQSNHLLQVLEPLMEDNPYSLYIKASILVNNKKYSSAGSFLKDSLTKYPDDIKLRNLYGRVLLFAGNTDAGRGYIENSLKINPKSMGSLRLLIEESITSKDWKRAEGYLTKLLLNDNSETSLRYAVEIYQNLGENQKALNYNEEILKSENVLHKDYLVTIKLLLQKGMNLQALEDINSWLAISKNTEDKSYFYYLKSLALTDTREKLVSLRQSLFENLQNLDAMLAISDVYYELNDKRNSYRYLKQALILSHGDDKIKDKIRKLEKEM